jgi:hypothetical protein
MKSKEQKRAEADLRQEEYNKLTPTQKIKQLNNQLGQDVGAKKQRAKLAKLV